MSSSPLTRRQLLLGAAGWIPFLHRRTVSFAGVRFRRIRRGGADRTYVVLHGDERTALRVLEDWMQEAGGVAYLVENSERNVRIGGLQIDPNRLFSRVGAEASLRRLNPETPAGALRAALDSLDRARPRLLDALFPGRGRLLVALHNNSDAYSVHDEIPISDRVCLNEPSHPDEFMLCTDARDFETLCLAPYNVVLQDKAPGNDDGSLSREAARRGARYVNIEAAHGQAAKQTAMLAWLHNRLS